MTLEQFRTTVRVMLADGVFPTPKKLAERCGWKEREKTPSGRYPGGKALSGRYCAVRREELERAGYTKNWVTGRWEKRV